MNTLFLYSQNPYAGSYDRYDIVSLATGSMETDRFVDMTFVSLATGSVETDRFIDMTFVSLDTGFGNRMDL